MKKTHHCSAIELNRIVEQDPNSEDLFQPHWVLDVYPNRPDELESSSLYEILSWYERVSFSQLYVLVYYQTIHTSCYAVE